MAILNNVVLVGATGNLGPHILKNLKDASDITVRVLARPTSSILKNPPEGITIITADFNSNNSLVKALTGVDAVIFSTGMGGFLAQRAFLDAAIEAGVKRFIPSEFGSDLENPKAASMAVYSEKVQVRKEIKERAARGDITWSAISNGPFLDWGLKTGFLGINAKTNTATLFDGGNRYLSFTTLNDVGKAVVGILRNPEETKNKLLYVQSIRTTAEKILGVVEKTVGSKFNTSIVSTEELEKKAADKISNGDFSGFVDQIIRVVYGEEYGGDFEGRISNELLGVKQLNEVELEVVVQEAIKG
ncbi:hypothetical protein EDC01DRAFT_715868 [Geopyxis carbonaria]|nr:hypothetical protein EDC01DRAFT_715868 [Geopyxis carbonaria]